METLLSVGGPRPPVVEVGWDAWPLVGMILGTWVARRVLELHWGPTLVVWVIISTLGLPLAVEAWGVVPALALTLIPASVRLAARGRTSGTPPRKV